MKSYPYSKARRDFGSIVRKVSSGEAVTITRAGVPHVAIIPVDRYLRLRGEAQLRDATGDLIQAFTSFPTENATVLPEAFMGALGASLSDLASWSGGDELTILSSPDNETLQVFLRACLEALVHMQTAWAGSLAEIMALFKSEPLKEFEGRTALALVSHGRART